MKIKADSYGDLGLVIGKITINLEKVKYKATNAKLDLSALKNEDEINGEFNRNKQQIYHQQAV